MVNFKYFSSQHPFTLAKSHDSSGNPLPSPVSVHVIWVVLHFYNQEWNMQPHLSQSAHHTSPATEMGLGETGIWSIRIRLSEDSGKGFCNHFEDWEEWRQHSRKQLQDEQIKKPGPSQINWLLIKLLMKPLRFKPFQVEFSASCTEIIPTYVGERLT